MVDERDDDVFEGRETICLVGRGDMDPCGRNAKHCVERAKKAVWMLSDVSTQTKCPYLIAAYQDLEHL